MGTARRSLRAAAESLGRARDLGILAAAIANQTDDHHIGLGEAGEHAQQHAFAHARARHQSDALATADGEHAIDGLDTHIQHVADRATLHRVERPAEQAELVLAHRGGLAVQWHATAIYHAAQQGVAQACTGRVADDTDLGAGTNALRLSERHQKQGLVVEAHHLGLDALTGGTAHLTGGAQRRHDAARFHAQANQPHQGTGGLGRRRPQPIQPLINLVGKTVHSSVLVQTMIIPVDTRLICPPPPVWRGERAQV